MNVGLFEIRTFGLSLLVTSAIGHRVMVDIGDDDGARPGVQRDPGQLREADAGARAAGIGRCVGRPIRRCIHACVPGARRHLTCVGQPRRAGDLQAAVTTSPTIHHRCSITSPPGDASLRRCRTEPQHASRTTFVHDSSLDEEVCYSAH